MTTTIPRFFIRHSTPKTELFAYPRPGVDDRSLLSRRPTWEGVTDDQRVIDASEAGHFVVVPERVTHLVATWNEPGGRGDWRKVSMDKIDLSSELVRDVYLSAPETPTLEARERLANDAYDEDDVDTVVLRRIYNRERLPDVQESRSFDVSDHLELSNLDPVDRNPDVPWVPADASAVALYGPGFAHLLPGVRPGFRAAVTEALKALPQVKHVFENHERTGKTRVHWVSEWEIPKPRQRYAGEKGRGPFFSTVAVDHRADVFVPETLQAVDKAAAIEGWDAAVAEFVARCVPTTDTVTACSHCDGRGYHRSES